ncbi:hypothetical protein PpBr36_08825, partial [Pyricularia pennisetigena]|uniref:hypothetical protein n=1 Tax=Pyricularia pennisetigena TaxID=1578925 RepID=UPI0011514731
IMSSERPESDTSGSPRASIAGPSSGQRRERGAIAAQVSHVLSLSRASSENNKTGYDQRTDLSFFIITPTGLRKDKTLVEILERIKGLERKFDTLTMQQAAFHAPMMTNHPVVTQVSMPQDSLSPMTATGAHASEDGSIVAGVNPPHAYATSVHQMLGWPIIQQLLNSVSARMPEINVANIEQEGVNIILGINKSDYLPAEPVGPVTTIDSTTSMPNPSISGFGGIPLTTTSMQVLSNAYFDTFNHCHPLLERHTFMSEILGPLCNDGLDDTVKSTLGLVVFALGELSIAGDHGAPVTMYNTRPSGVKGGTLRNPPGLALYNEARRRMGFTMADSSLETAQAFALAGLYCEACFSHTEFWRMTMSAALACQALVLGRSTESSSASADMIRRCFWHCKIMERQVDFSVRSFNETIVLTPNSYFDIELGLPRGILEQLEDIVGPPVFSGLFSHDYITGTSLARDHFVSAVAMRRLALEAHAMLNNGHFASRYSTGALDPDGFNLAVKNLASQAEHWRTMLPPQLRWRETQPGEFPNPSLYSDVHNSSVFGTAPSLDVPSPALSSPSGFMFTTDLDVAPVTYPYNLDIMTAVLRSRYYYIKLVIHRPYVYKALVNPEQMTGEEAEGAAECLRACLKWPVSMSPTHAHKRLIPCLFFWTQNMLGILILLHLSQSTPMLSRIRSTLCGESFELEASETVGLYLDWLRDLKSVDAAAAWAWAIVRAIYNLEE